MGNQSFTSFSPLVFSHLLLFQNAQVETISFGEGNGWLLAVTDHEHIGVSGGEGLSIGISDVGDVETTQVLLDVHQGTNSTDVVTSGQVHKFSGFVLEPGGNLSLLKVILEGVSLFDFGVGESDGSAVVGHNVWDLVASNGFGLHLQKLVFGFVLLDGHKGESSLDIVKHSVVLVGLDNGKNIESTDGEFSISSDFVIDLDAGFSVLKDKGHFTGSQSKRQSLSQDDRKRKTFSKLVGTLAWSNCIDSSHFGKQP